MDLPTQQPLQPGVAERITRGAVLLFLLLAILTLTFAFGYGTRELRTRETPASVGNGNAVGRGGTSTTVASGTETSALIDEVCGVLETQHVDRSTITPQSCRDAAINGIISSLNDPHTSYISPADLASGALDMGSTYQGIGASVSDKSGQVQIVAPFRDSPAEKAGIKAGDIVLEVDGQRTDGWSDQEAVQHIRGIKGTPVALKVQHQGGQTETITVVRGDIEIQSVYAKPNLEIIPGESGDKLVDRDGKEVTDLFYVNISQFHENTLNEFRTLTKDVQAKGYKGLILDLRSNPGGLLDATVAVADEFLDKGTVLSEVDANGKSQTWTAKPGGLLTKIPVVILQDQSSASGSEVLASALRDNGRATIVGTRSFGKGTVNQLMPLKSCGDPKGCGAVYVAVGRWLTPKAGQIEGVGVKPDVELPMTSNDYVTNGDIQLFKAIDVLRGK